VPVYTGLSYNQGSLCAGNAPLCCTIASVKVNLPYLQYLEQLLHVNQLVNLTTLLESTTAPHLLCFTNQLLNFETKQILLSLFKSLRQKQFVKIILIPQSEDDTVTIL